MISLLPSIAAVLNDEPFVDYAIYLAAYLVGFLSLYLPGSWLIDRYLGPGERE